MLFLFIGIISGAIITWIITHLYYVHSNREQHKIYNKLSLELREIILNDKRENLNVIELNELIKRKTVGDSYNGLLPYKACPKCGSKNLKRHEESECDMDENGFVGLPHTWEVIKCLDCGWSEDTYSIT